MAIDSTKKFIIDVINIILDSKENMQVIDAVEKKVSEMKVEMQPVGIVSMANDIERVIKAEYKKIIEKSDLVVENPNKISRTMLEAVRDYYIKEKDEPIVIIDKNGYPEFDSTGKSIDLGTSKPVTNPDDIQFGDKPGEDPGIIIPTGASAGALSDIKFGDEESPFDKFRIPGTNNGKDFEFGDESVNPPKNDNDDGFHGPSFGKGFTDI